MKYICASVWNKGKRAENEDAFCIRYMEQNGIPYLLAVVCDGIGGLQDGKDASSYTVFSLRNAMEELFLQNPYRIRLKDVRKFWEREICRCHFHLERYQKRVNRKSGTTLSMIFLCGKKGFLFHLGDSRVYQGKYFLKKMTPDQCNSKKELLRCVGAGQYHTPFIKKIQIKKENGILICSDGFYRKNQKRIRNGKIIKWMGNNEENIQSILKEMSDQAMQQGEKDNMTAVCIKRIR